MSSFLNETIIATKYCKLQALHFFSFKPWFWGLKDFYPEQRTSNTLDIFVKDTTLFYLCGSFRFKECISHHIEAAFITQISKVIRICPPLRIVHRNTEKNVNRAIWLPRSKFFFSSKPYYCIIIPCLYIHHFRI